MDFSFTSSFESTSTTTYCVSYSKTLLCTRGRLTGALYEPLDRGLLSSDLDTALGIRNEHAYSWRARVCQYDGHLPRWLFFRLAESRIHALATLKFPLDLSRCFRWYGCFTIGLKVERREGEDSSHRQL